MIICVIGLGSMGKRRIRILKKSDQAPVIVGVDSNKERANSVKEAYKINTYLSMEDVREKPDFAFICTPPLSHGTVIRNCLELGMHVFSEINLVNDLYDENIRLAKEKGKVLFLSSTSIYKSEMRYISRQVHQNGNPCVYQYHIGQYLPDWHPWDNLRDFFASNRITNGCREYLAIELPWIQKAFGRIESINVIKRQLTGLNLDFPDVYLIQLEHANGNAGSLIVDVVSREAVKKLEIMNEELYIRWDGKPDSLYKKDVLSGELKQIVTGKYVHEQGYGDFVNEYAYVTEIEEFFNAVRGKKVQYGFEDDKETLRIIDEIEMWGLKNDSK